MNQSISIIANWKITPRNEQGHALAKDADVEELIGLLLGLFALSGRCPASALGGDVARLPTGMARVVIAKEYHLAKNGEVRLVRCEREHDEICVLKDAKGTIVSSPRMRVCDRTKP
jgi:hypothetical protein